MRVLFIIYDNENYVNLFPLGIAYISSALRNRGDDITILQQDIEHYPDEYIKEYLDKNQFDIVGISFVGGYYQYRKIISLSKYINQSKNRNNFKYIIGGHGPSPEPEYFIKKTDADFVVMGEGEETIVELLNTIENNGKFDKVKGIAYRDESEKIIINERRELIREIDKIPFPAYDLFPMNIYRLFRRPNCTNTDFIMPILSGRGCTFNCNFCYRLDKGLRIRSNENIIEEIKYLKKEWNINYIFFMDELLMSSEKRTISLCEDIIKSNTNIKFWCNGRLNYAKKEVLKVMKEAGCVFINYGIESFNDDMLKVMKKGLNIKIIESGVKNTIESGISPGLCVMFGNIGETKEHLKNTTDFILKYDNQSQMRTLRPTSPYPGSPLYYHAIEKGLLEGPEDFYDNKHFNSDLLSVNFTNMSDEEVHKLLYDENMRIIDNYYKKQKEKMEEETRKLFLENNKDFRGYRHH